MRKSKLLFFFFWWTLSLAGQTSTDFYVVGIVTDEASGEPVENVNILVKEGKQGTTTNELGEFKVRVQTLPFTLEFSHVSYHTITKSFDYPPSRSVVIEMNARSEPLTEVVVTAQKIDTLFEDDIYSVLDYELTDEGIILLIFKARLSKSEILHTDFKGNEISTMPVLPGKPLALFKDCLDNVHILTKTRVYQLFTGADHQIGIMKGVDADKFKKVMGGCLFTMRNKLYFEAYDAYNFSKLVFYVDTIDSTYHELVTVIDQDKFDMLEDNPEDYETIFSNSMETPNLGDLRSTGSDFFKLDQIRNLTAEARFNKMAYYSEIYAPVLKIGDSVCIFNHPNDQLDFYSTDDSLKGSVPIRYHLEKKKNPITTFTSAFAPSHKWLKEVYTDIKTRRAYTMVRNLNGTRDLMEINLLTGATTYILTIPFPYVQKIKINGGYLYFVYRGWGDGHRKKLFRQRIN